LHPLSWLGTGRRNVRGLKRVIRNYSAYDAEIETVTILDSGRYSITIRQFLFTTKLRAKQEQYISMSYQLLPEKRGCEVVFWVEVNLEQSAVSSD